MREFIYWLKREQGQPITISHFISGKFSAETGAERVEQTDVNVPFGVVMPIEMLGTFHAATRSNVYPYGGNIAKGQSVLVVENKELVTIVDGMPVSVKVEAGDLVTLDRSGRKFIVKRILDGVREELCMYAIEEAAGHDQRITLPDILE